MKMTNPGTKSYRGCHVVQFNIRGVAANGGLFLRYLELHDVHVFCLQETWLSCSSSFKVPGYTLYRQDRARFGGGLLIGVSRHYHSRVCLPTLHLEGCEVLGVQLWHSGSTLPLTIINVYSPTGLCKYSSSDLDTFFHTLPSQWLVLGDFNAHSSLWDRGPPNRAGRYFQLLLNTSPFVVLLNDGSPTMVASTTGSAPDLSLASSNIAADIAWHVGAPLGSDHYPVHLNFCFGPPSPEVSRPRLINWTFYTKGMPNPPPTATGDVALDCATFIGLIHRSTRQATKQVPNRSVSPKSHQRWWNKDCRLAQCARNRAFRNYKRCANRATKIAYSRCCAALRKTIKLARRTSWRVSMGNISSFTSLPQLWRVLGSLMGRHPQTTIPNLVVPLIASPTLQNIAEVFRLHYHSFFSSFPSVVPPDDLASAAEAFDSALCLPFTLSELTFVLDRVHDTTPGPDLVTYSHLKHLPASHKELLLQMYNASWRTGYVPDSWKLSTLIPILKPGKSGDAAEHYRPIVLTPTIAKVMEKLVKNRLDWYMTKHTLWAPEQSGGRLGRSVHANLLWFYREAQIALSERGYLVAAFLDLEKAFDSIQWNHILSVMRDYGFPAVVLRWIRSFLSDRRVCVRIGDYLSPPFHPLRGVPQGSVLGPFLFCLVVNVLPSLVPTVSLSLFMDDHCLWSKGLDLAACCRNLNTALSILHNWSQKHGLTFNASKSTVLVITLRTSPTVYISLGGIRLPQRDSFKFLGVVFDRRLTWGPYLSYLKAQVLTRLQVLRAISGTTWGTSGMMLYHSYKSMVLPVLLYGAIFIYRLAEAPFTTLDRLHYTAARTITGLPRSTAIPALLLSAGLPPLRLLCHQSAFALAGRFWTSSDPFLRDLVRNPSVTFPTAFWPRGLPLSLDVRNSSLGSFLRQIPDAPPIRLLPPWMLASPSIDLTATSTVPHSPASVQAVNQELAVASSSALLIFTDGSKRLDRSVYAGFYIPARDVLLTFTLRRFCSVYEAEVVAILMALQWALEHCPRDALLVATDCLSVLQAVRSSEGGGLNRSPLIYEVYYVCYILSLRGTDVTLKWVPSHVGIHGNEIIDFAVRTQAHVGSSLAVTIPLGRRALHLLLQQSLLTRWQRSYDDYEGRIRRYQTVVLLGYAPLKLTRFSEVLWHRWRCGRAPVGYYLNTIGARTTPLCSHCGSIDTEDHVFFGCAATAAAREWLTQKLDSHSLPFTDTHILGRDLHLESYFQRFIQLTGCSFSL